MVEKIPYVMGIDYGTESCRVSIIDLYGKPLTFAATPYRTTHPHPGWAEQNPRDWWEALQASTAIALKNSGISPSQIIGISYDATTLTLVALGARGEVLRPAIMWMDVRATEQADRAEKSDSVARLYNGGGSAPAIAEWYPFKAAWLKENEPEVYRDTAHLVDAPDWVNYQLTGEWTTNINSAALRMYYNSNKGGWPLDFYETIGCGDVFEKISESIVNLGSPVGKLAITPAQLLGLPPGIPVAQGGGDAWSGQIGLGVLEPGSVALITGSSHVMTGQAAEEIHGPGFFGAYTDAVMPGQYTVECGQTSTGSVLKWFKDNFVSDIVNGAEKLGLSPYRVLDEKAQHIPPGCDGLLISEYFQGNRTPYADSKARGVMLGLSLMHTPIHIYRAIMEAVCYGTAQNLQTLKNAGMDVNRMVLCGGATKSREWVQMHADVCNVPVTLTEVGDAVVLGTGMLAAVGAGAYSDLREAAKNMVHELEVIEPDEGMHEKYKFYFDKYRQTYAAGMPINHDLVNHETGRE